MEKSLTAIRKCDAWLAACLELGWPKKDLDNLEKLFWKYRDFRTGNLK